MGDDAVKIWYSAIKVCVWIGLLVMAVPSIVLGCMPACCGKQVPKRKIFGGIGIFLGFLALIMPFIGAKTGAAGACAKLCKEAECEDYAWCADDAGKTACKEYLGGLGVFVAYTAALGFLPLICGIVGMSVSGAAICGCCKAKDAAGGEPVVAGA